MLGVHKKQLTLSNYYKQQIPELQQQNLIKYIHKKQEHKEQTTKLKQICFTQDLLKSLFNGNKKQTRRIIKNVTSFEDLFYVEPKYEEGDIVYVGEEWQSYTYESEDYILYKYDFLQEDANKLKWNSAKSLDEENSRCKLLITSVTLQKLQDISVEDIYKEGFYIADYIPDSEIYSEFATFWDKIYNYEKGKCFDDNPYVWVYKFSKIT